MKYLVLVPDGCADEPLDELDHRTPLEAAHMPRLAALAAAGEVGLAAVIPDGLPPGSDVGNLAILGYDPAVYHTGRAPIEAAAMGVELDPTEVAYRCNLVTIDDAGTMVDFAAGHLDSAQSHPIVAALDDALGGGRDGIRFHAGVEYRHLCVVPGDLAVADCVPPHDLTGQRAVMPTGPAAARLIELMDASKPVVRDAAAQVGSIATQIWLWGQGIRPQLPDFAARYGVAGRLSSAVDLVRGLGVLTGIEVVDVPGATAGFDNDYTAQRDAALASLADRDLFLLHVEATDEAGHQGAVKEKVTALEQWDERDHRATRRCARGRALPRAPPARPRDSVRVAYAHARAGAVPALRLAAPRLGRGVHRARRGRLRPGRGASPHGAPRRLTRRRILAGGPD